jgi:hypothetical protein
MQARALLRQDFLRHDTMFGQFLAQGVAIKPEHPSGVDLVTARAFECDFD